MRLTKDITLGKYFPGNSFVHRLDPRTKIVNVVIILTAVFAAKTWITYAFVAVAILITVFAAHIPARLLFNNLRPFLFILIFTFAWHLIFLPVQGAIVLKVGDFVISQKALLTAMFYCIRIAMFILLSSLLTLTTAPLELTDAIEVILAPLKKFKIPIHEFALMTSIAIRFIPTIMDEAEKLYLAQKNRGARFDGALHERLQALLALTIPLLTNAFKRAEELALAMEARCYDNHAQRTNYKRLKWNWRDSIVLCSAGLSAALILTFERLS